MKIEYIYHSSFTVTTDDDFLVFDYFKGDFQFPDKDIIVFATHGHGDHYTPKIFDWLKERNHILYVLSSDIEAVSSEHVYIMDSNEDLKLFDIDIQSFGSTDLGLSYLVRIDGKNIFHAGDLNWWYWDDDSDEEKQHMEKAFKDEIQKLKGINIDVAFFPVDPRLGKNYHLGGEYFINEIKPKVFIPMHFGDNLEITKDFVHKIGITTTNIVEIKGVNQIIEI